MCGDNQPKCLFFFPGGKKEFFFITSCLFVSIFFLHISIFLSLFEFFFPLPVGVQYLLKAYSSSQLRSGALFFVFVFCFAFFFFFFFLCLNHDAGKFPEEEFLDGTRCRFLPAFRSPAESGTGVRCLAVPSKREPPTGEMAPSRPHLPLPARPPPPVVARYSVSRQCVAGPRPFERWEACPVRIPAHPWPRLQHLRQETTTARAPTLPTPPPPPQAQKRKKIHDAPQAMATNERNLQRGGKKIRRGCSLPEGSAPGSLF